MAATTEVEIFGLLADNLKQAAEDCRQLAWHPRRGPLYRRFLKATKEIAGCCRQAYYWRDYDSRWLYISQDIEAIKEMTGRWMRDSATKAAREVAHPMFVSLADLLEKLGRDAEVTRTAATGHIGPILPKPLPLDRDTRPVQVKTPSGIILN